MRRAQSGWEADGAGGDIRATWTTETTSTAWTAVVNGTAARTGSYGLHITRSTASGALSAGAYETIALDTGTPRWSAAPNAAAFTQPFLGSGTGHPRRAWLRVYWKPVTITVGASNNFFLLQLADVSNVNVASVEFRTGTGLALNIAGSNKGAFYAPSVGNWYRLELLVEIDHIYSSGVELHTTGWVYDATGTTPLGVLSASHAAATWSDAKRINVGYRVNTIQSNNAQEGYFDDFAVNDEKVASGQSGVHVQSPWGGATRNFLSPNAIGSNAAWAASAAGGNWAQVDEWVYNDATDYCRTPAAATTPKDSHNFPNPTFPGSEVTKSLGVICRAQDFAGGFPYYKMGVLESGTDLEVDHNQTGGWFHHCAAVGEVGGGGAWTNAKVNAAELMYRKTTADASAQQDVSAICCEIEDDDSLGSPPAYGAKQRQRGGEM